MASVTSTTLPSPFIVDTVLHWRGAFRSVDWTSNFQPVFVGTLNANSAPRTADSKSFRIKTGSKGSVPAKYSSVFFAPRSEERRVGKECRCRWSPDDEKKKKRKKHDG